MSSAKRAHHIGDLSIEVDGGFSGRHSPLRVEGGVRVVVSSCASSFFVMGFSLNLANRRRVALPL